MRIHWNKVTWYSRLIAIVVFVATFFWGFYIGKQYEGALLTADTAAQQAQSAIASATPRPTGGLRPLGSDIVNDVIFGCPGGRDIYATFYASQKVSLQLPDGRQMTLPQAISASGARYANADESFVFWNKGDTAFIQENRQTTYTGCIVRPSGR